MANGDITHVKELGRSRAEGGGSTTAGIAKNSKVFVWGEIKGTYASTGMAMNDAGGVRAFGLDTLDFIHLEVKLAGTGAVESADDLLFLANYKRTTDKIFVCDQVGASDPAVPTAGDVITLAYWAGGDSNSAPDQV